jgi:predicted transcriptional regulator/exonuclease VII small subunit
MPRVRKLLKSYFSGLSQPAIAEKLHISQASVSNWVSTFKGRAYVIGLLNTAKEFEVMDEVNKLRSLAVELSDVDLTVDDAVVGVDIIKKFSHLGIKPEQHETLIHTCGKVNDPGFVHAAVKLSALETEKGVTYEEAVSRFETVTTKLPQKESQLQETEGKLKIAEAKVAQAEKKLADLEAKYDLLVTTVKGKLAEYDQEIKDKMKESEVAQEEINQISALKSDLGKVGLDIPTLIKLAKEFGHGGKEH